MCSKGEQMLPAQVLWQSTEHPGSPRETQCKSGTRTSVQPEKLWTMCPNLDLLCHRARRGLGPRERLGKGQRSCPQPLYMEG